MDPGHWRRIEELYARAMALTGEARAAFLREACGEDPPLHRELTSLLAAEAEMGSFLEASQAGAAPAPSADPWLGRRIGPWQILRSIGEGGMGRVYLADRADGEFRRQVALKLVKPIGNPTEILRRFRTERQILAGLDHPWIARLLDGASTEEGWPYLVMEHVDGQPIDRYCAESGLPLRPRLELFLQVCDAVQHAHRHLIVHRDLKPSNILVTGDGVPKLLDFGIAKLLDGGPAATSALGLRPMTPGWASPEQVLGGPVSTASDVYALGVLLYQLATGRHPHGAEHRSPLEVARSVCEEEPEPPSVRLQADAGNDAAARHLRRQLAGDLDNIILKAMRKEPERRYGSVHEFAADVRRHLDGFPVTARRETLSYRLTKLIRRHRWATAAVATAFALGLALVVSLTLQRAELRQQKARAERVTELLLELFSGADPTTLEAPPPSLRELLDRGAARLAAGLDDAPGVRAALDQAVGVIYLRLGDHALARRHLEAALAVERQLGGRSPEVAKLLNLLGALHRAEGDYDTAETHLEAALEIGRDRLGDDHPAVLKTHNDLAVVLQARGDLAGAEGILRQVIDHRRHLDDTSIELAESLNNLGVVLYYQGRYGEAEAAWEDAVERFRGFGDGEHLWLAEGLANLAALRLARGDAERAVELYRESLERHRERLGERHPEVATILNNLAAALKVRGQLGEAIDLFRKSLAIRREILGEEHPDVAESLGNLGATLRVAGQWDEAEAHLLDSLGRARQLFGDRHLNVANTLFHLASLRLDTGAPRATIEHARKSREIFRELAPEHPRLAAVEGLLERATHALDPSG